MIFNEILIPQDSFTETNVTRKRSIVGIHNFIPELIKIPPFVLIHSFFIFDDMKAIMESHIIPK